MDSNFERILSGKKRKSQDAEAPTFSFKINLVPSSEDVSAEYSWKDLVEKCRDEDQTHLEINTPLKLKPKASKKRLTPTPKKKKRRKLDEESEYDFDDPFIDDEELTDEEIPPELTTARGGFYINVGALNLIKKPTNIFDEDTEEMMDKLDDMDECTDTEPEGDAQERREEGGEDEVTLSNFPKMTDSPKPKVAVKKSFVKVNKVKSLATPSKVKKKVKKEKLTISEKLKTKKKAKQVDSSNKENINQVQGKENSVSTPKKVEGKSKSLSSTPKKEILTPKKQKQSGTPKKENKTPKKDAVLSAQKPVATPKKEKSSPKKKVQTETSSPKKKVKTASPTKKIKAKVKPSVKKVKKQVKVVKTRKKILPSQLPDMSDYDKQIMAIVSKTETNWKCIQCPHEHESRANVLVHAEQHFPETVLQCVICEKTFSMKRNLKQHVLKNHAEPDTTNIKKKFNKDGNAIKVATKKTVNTAKKKVVKDCKISKKSIKAPTKKKVVNSMQLCYTEDFDLKVAELVEKSEEKWKCKACDNTSDTKALILKHAEQHVEGFTLPCLLCDKTFTMKRVLKQHMYTKHKDSIKTKSGKKEMAKSNKKKMDKEVTQVMAKPKVTKTLKKKDQSLDVADPHAVPQCPSQAK